MRKSFSKSNEKSGMRARGQESYQTIWKLTTIVKARTNE
jgi:hypothetical protein